ncbi:MAG: hypothetical protein Q8K58_02210 [Acidimicrobiales bacterium]|nr:hypothetical protein [Acidimicrobiales bacterium]
MGDLCATGATGAGSASSTCPALSGDARLAPLLDAVRSDPGMAEVSALGEHTVRTDRRELPGPSGMGRTTLSTGQPPHYRDPGAIGRGGLEREMAWHASVW